MPRRDDIASILIVGAGPIVIGQACEFDYSGAQACKALRAEGYRIVLVNSNPATIMTDPESGRPPPISSPSPPELGGAGHQARASGRPAPHHGRPDRDQRRDGAGARQWRRSITHGRRADRRQCPDAISTVRGPRGVHVAAMQSHWAAPCPKPRGVAGSMERARRAGGARSGYPAHHPTQLHAWVEPGAASPTIAEEFERPGPGRGLDASPITQVLIDRSGDRVEGVSSWRWCATRSDNVHHRVLHRELSTRWASTPATRSPWRPALRPSATSSTRRLRDAAIAMHAAKWVWRPAAANIQFAVNPRGRASCWWWR